MKFKEEDFSRLMFNVHSLPKGDILKKFPDLEKYKEFNATTAFDKDKVLRYIIYCYDKQSPLLKEADLSKRKTLALELAGFVKNKKGEYPNHDALIKMAGCENEVINRMMIRFIRMQRDLDFTALIAITQNFWNTVSLLNSNTVYNKDEDKLKDQKTKGELSKMIPEMLEEIKNISKNLFHGDYQLVYTADDVAQEEDSTPYAESFARSVDNG